MTSVPDTVNPHLVSTSAAPTSSQSVEQLPSAAIDFANRMFDLARRGDQVLIDYLSAGLPPNLTNNRGDTLLMLACYHGHTDLVRRMLTECPQDAIRPTDPDNPVREWRGRLDPNQLNGRGQSIVAGAVFKGYDAVVRLLIEHYADPLAGQPSAEECAQMFNKWHGESGYHHLFENAPGRGLGGRQAAPAVEDREEFKRIPGVGLQRTGAELVLPSGEQQNPQPRQPSDHPGTVYTVQR